MTFALRRTLPFSSDHQIDRDGYVWHTESRTRVPHCSCESRHGINCLSVWLGERHWIVWQMLSDLFYEGRLILPSNGNFLSWSAKNTVVLEKVRSRVITDSHEIHAIWYWHKNEHVPCRLLAEKTGLIRYGEQDFRTLIEDILIAGVP